MTELYDALVKTARMMDERSAPKSTQALCLYCGELHPETPPCESFLCYFGSLYFVLEGLNRADKQEQVKKAVQQTVNRYFGGLTR
jgi:hypothetical protein